MQYLEIVYICLCSWFISTFIITIVLICSCRPQGSGTEAIQLIEDLGLQDSALLASLASKNRYIFYDGKVNVRTIERNT